MSGTAAGAAKARERKARMPDGRQPSDSHQQPDGALIVADGSDGGLMPTVASAEQAVGSLLPDAVAVVGRILRGTLRVPAAVRAQTAMRLIELSHKPGGTPAQPEGLAGAVAALGKAFALRSRTFEAVDASVVSVVPPQSSQSQ